MRAGLLLGSVRENMEDKVFCKKCTHCLVNYGTVFVCTKHGTRSYVTGAFIWWTGFEKNANGDCPDFEEIPPKEPAPPKEPSVNEALFAEPVPWWKRIFR